MSPPEDSPVTPSTVLEALVASERALAAAGTPEPRRDGEVLLAHLLGVDRAFLYAHPERRLESVEARRLLAWIGRRARHEPIAYITGVREFWSLELTVNPGVLIPRPETERLVEVCLDALGGRQPGRIADIGTGSGAVVAALATALPQTRFVATDIDPEALRTAERNLERLGLNDRVELRLGDLYSALSPRMRFDAIVSNPPYVPDGAMATLMPDVRDFEPVCALAGGPDGLSVIGRLIAGASDYLTPGAALIVEIGSDQGRAVRDALARAGFEAIAIHTDLAGLARVAFGRVPLAPDGPA